ncbi:tight junction protein ZO-2 isoform X3 [Planococcus citri]|uniref:tight junction protein ZO-2 isoform X3 n=1 Tax=Planococcus citri TaxID=170843 RepID=UPI0031F9ED2E
MKLFGRTSKSKTRSTSGSEPDLRKRTSSTFGTQRRAQSSRSRTRFEPASYARKRPSSNSKNGERVVWEFQQVTLNRVPGYGFGIAVSGGRDNPHFANGDPSIAVSDVLKAGPAEGKLMVNDRITSANGISLENVDYGRAVQVLRDSGNSVTLSVRRRLLLPSQEPHILRVQLNKSRKKDDFGIILGNRIYIKEIGNTKIETNAGPTLQEGDVILKINNQPAENLSLKEARKLIESSKEKLHLTVRREARTSPYSIYSNNNQPKESNYMDMLNGNVYGASQNLYVQPPTRQNMSLESEKSNLMPRTGRSRNPLLDVSLTQLDRPASPLNRNLNHSHESIGNLPPINHSHSLSHNINQENHDIIASQHTHLRSRSVVQDHQEPPRPPPPRPEDYYGITKLQEDETNGHRSKFPIEDPRFVAFHKDSGGSVGIRLIGGNEVGIFVTAVQPGSPASLQGLQPADKILKANDLDMKGVTHEEAVLFLSNVQDQVHLIVQNKREEYEQVLANHLGDSFHIKAHFDYDQPEPGEMSFRKGDIFHVIDTLHNNNPGSWQVYRIGRNNQEVQKGIIPNKARAEELATKQFNATKKEIATSESRISFFRRKRSNHRRSKSLSKDHWDDVVFGDSISKFPAYERVILKHPGFIRPVVLFGPVADIAREKLLKDFPDKFSAPQLENPLEGVSKKASGIIRLSAIRDIMDRGKHALLDITPNAVDRLNYAQFYPIVILLRAESKQVIKDLRNGITKSAHKSSRKLFEQSQKLEKVWSHVFCGSITLTGPDSWYRKLRELIEKYQSSPVWISEAKPDEALSDDFLFPMTSLRLSYASSPESDLEQSSGLLNMSSTSLPPRLVKCSSDPSIATQDDTAVPTYNPPPPYTPALFKQTAYELNQNLRLQNDKFPFLPSAERSSNDEVNGVNGTPPDLPPRIDRNSKPVRTVNGRSAQERLFGGPGSKEQSEPPNYINATPHRLPNSTSLGRHNSNANSSTNMNNKTNSYDSVSSYDSYNQRSMSNIHDDLKTYSDREPYRYTRSTQQPIKHSNSDAHRPSKPPDYPHYRPPGLVEYATNKPLPPPKAPQSYKPVPPPKPKNYRPPNQHAQQSSQPYFQHSTIKEMNGYQHAKSYSMADATSNNYSTHIPNGITSSPSSKYSIDNSDSNGFDSGHGSSLDRSTYDRRTGMSSNSSQYYYNVAPSNKHQRELSGLDLTHREQRGSAFELYKKPSEQRNMHYHIDHSIR